MLTRVQFECQSCGEGFVDWHDDEWERIPVFCVNCGEAILPGAALEGSPSAPRDDDPDARSLGVLKSEADEREQLDTLPELHVPDLGAPLAERADYPPDESSEPLAVGLEADGSAHVLESEAPRESGDSSQSSIGAASVAPGANSDASSPRARRRRFGPLGALLLGFVVGIPLTLLAEDPLLRILDPAAAARAELAQQLSSVSTAIDEDKLNEARQLLEYCGQVAPKNDRRVATLRARLALGFILDNRQRDAERELVAVEQLPRLHPAVDEVRRVSAALFPTATAAAPVNSALPASSAPVAAAPLPTASAVPAAPPPPKPTVSKHEVLAFAQGLQRRLQLDDAERLYKAVLSARPKDAEARCGLAEVSLLRGGVGDGEQLFERALQDNPGYAPAWVGLADIDWLRGRSARAACRYQAVIDRFPAGSYPPYIVQRVAQASSSGVNLPKAKDEVAAPRACDP